MNNHDLLEALKVTRAELKQVHAVRLLNTSDPYRLSDGAAQCARVLDMAEHAIEQAEKPEQGQDTPSQYIPAVFMDLLSAASRAQAYLDANGPGRGDPEVEAAQSARIQELFSENTIARRQLAGKIIDLERLKIDIAGLKGSLVSRERKLLAAQARVEKFKSIIAALLDAYAPKRRVSEPADLLPTVQRAMSAIGEFDIEP